MRYIRLLLFTVLLACNFGFANAQSSEKSDTVQVKKTEVVHSPRKATLYSAVLPGLGQIYNKKYWKLPLIYGGFVGFGVAIDYYTGQYNKFGKAYADITDNDPRTNSFLDLKYKDYFNLSNSGDVKEYASFLKKARDGSRRYRDMDIIFTAAFYALNIMDASVDAHFFNFDISDDLSFVWTPEALYCMDQQVVGVRCRFTF